MTMREQCDQFDPDGEERCRLLWGHGGPCSWRLEEKIEMARDMIVELRAILEAEGCQSTCVTIDEFLAELDEP
jgi:hypothetical protein